MVAAIGDGNNDVGMLREANIGISVVSRESVAAAGAADFGIKSFNQLTKLLLVHGAEAHRRNTYLILYQIYKNIVFVTPSLIFSMYSGFSGVEFYDSIMA